MKGTKRFGLLRLPMVLLLVLVLRLTMGHFVLQGVARHLVPMSSGVVGSNLREYKTARVVCQSYIF